MPLRPGKSRTVIGSNIKELQATGRPHNVAVAAALHNAYGPHRDDGGAVDGPVTGPLLGNTDGRADALSTSVPDGSHVLDANHVAALGDGNSVAGASKLAQMFPDSAGMNKGQDGGMPGIKGGGKGMAAPAVKPSPMMRPMKLNQASIPRMPRMPHIATPKAPASHMGMKSAHMPHMPGMKPPHSGIKTHFRNGGAPKPVPCKLSDGEWILSSADVTRIGNGDIERGHRAIDAWVMLVRKHHIEKLSRLPPPVQS